MERDHLLRDVDRRLFRAIRKLAATGEVPGLKTEVLDVARDGPLIEQISDNLILHVILDHARGSADPIKAFLTENHRDFGTRKVEEALRGVGVEYFRDAGRFLGWSSSRSSSPGP